MFKSYRWKTCNFAEKYFLKSFSNVFICLWWFLSNLSLSKFSSVLKFLRIYVCTNFCSWTFLVDYKTTVVLTLSPPIASGTRKYCGHHETVILTLGTQWQCHTDFIHTSFCTLSGGLSMRGRVTPWDEALCSRFNPLSANFTRCSNTLKHWSFADFECSQRLILLC